MDEEVEVSVEGRLGVISLNRPAALNALNAGMIGLIEAALVRFSGDDNVRAILFEGQGRGFCSGGDVRAARAAVIEGRKAEADRFFAHEYRMNANIAGFAKPVVALSHGVVMGGGIGIAGHADFRFTVPDARYAMPEAAIGFVCDVGVNAILAKAPRHRALAFLMGGLPVTGADVLALGLADCAIDPSRLAVVRAGIVNAAGGSNPEAALVGLMQSESIQAGERAFCDMADRLEEAFDQTSAEDVVAAAADLADDPPTVAFATTLSGRSPTSLEAILQSHLSARRSQDIASVLGVDLRLARLIAGLPDFAEGVRAVLVDKDQRPKWQPPGFSGVPREAIAAAIAGSAPPAKGQA